MSKATAEAGVIVFSDAAAFDAWLANNHQLQVGVWIKMAKQHTGIVSITSDEAVDTGLCWGWISGQRKGLDDTYYLQKYVPRRPRSVWSQVNVDKVALLTKAGRMRAPGLAEIAAAKADGRWEMAYVSQQNAVTPPDLAAALAQNQTAQDHYDQLNKTERYAVILQVVKQKTSGGRAKQIETMVSSLATKLA